MRDIRRRLLSPKNRKPPFLPVVVSIDHPNSRNHYKNRRVNRHPNKTCDPRNRSLSGNDRDYDYDEADYEDVYEYDDEEEVMTGSEETNTTQTNSSQSGGGNKRASKSMTVTNYKTNSNTTKNNVITMKFNSTTGV